MRIKIMSDSPVEVALKAGPRGKGDWPGFESVYSRIARASERMGADRAICCSEEHVETMADLGSGHEERMKYRLHWLRMYGWLQD